MILVIVLEIEKQTFLPVNRRCFPKPSTMLRFLFIALLLLHGMIHVMGFAKAFDYGNITQLQKEISKPLGVLWLTTALLFIAAAVMYFTKTAWWQPGLAAVVLSQILIMTAWQDAKFGTLANVIIAIVLVLAFSAWRFERGYQQDVQAGIDRTKSLHISLLTEADIRHLPAPVQRYLRYAGVLNKPKVHEMRVVFDGEMREKGKDWFSFTSEQYNFFDLPTRLFFMKAKMFGVTVPGYHAYKNGQASMQIKLFGLFPIVNIQDGSLNKAETVTLFNDMCLMAPGSLISPAIQWDSIDDRSVKATFTVNDISISAVLYFNDQDQLINFISDDRYALPDKKQYRFSTPVGSYQNFHGYNIMSYGETVWHYPDGPFTYGKFVLKDIVYNERADYGF
jgi:hypothetical protein